MSILVLNAGSSSLKFGLYDDQAEQELAKGKVSFLGPSRTASTSILIGGVTATGTEEGLADYTDAVIWVLKQLSTQGLLDSIQTVGHRIVHGGTEFVQPTLLQQSAREPLLRLAELAPLHNPAALQAFDAADSALPNAKDVGVFDTMFFANLTPQAYLYPVPYEWSTEYGIRRYGFHGLSHEYCALQAAEHLNRQEDPSLKLVICHLGSGCSATAVHGNQPIATTMGMTPMEGLMMGTRCGSIDPGLILHLLDQPGWTVEKMREQLNRRSGLLGVSGISADYQELEQAATREDERATLAITMFTDRIRSTIGGLTVTLGGIDALVFTGGIGENSSSLCQQVCSGLECMGLQFSRDSYDQHEPILDLGTPESSARILSIQTDEERTIAQHVKPFTPSIP